MESAALRRKSGAGNALISVSLTLQMEFNFSFNAFTACLSAAEDKNLLCEAARCNGRSLAGRRRLQARRKATDVMVELVHSAQCAGISAKYVLSDSWFSAPKTVIALKKQEHLDTIAMLKKSKIKYSFLLRIRGIYKNTGLLDRM